MDFRLGRTQRLTKAEWGVCLGATLAAIVLHAIYLTHAGGLWRDETHSVHLATLFTTREMWGMVTHDNSPLLFGLVIRLWSAIGLGGTDFGLRCLGFGIGLALLAALWLSARVLTCSLPFVSLGLLAANLTLVRWGDSVRAYGLGCCLILVTLVLVWSLMRAPSLERFLAAALAAVVSVQCLYQNAFLLFAICVAGCFVCFRCRQDQTALLLVGVGAVAALSLAPYIGPVIASQRWVVVEQTGFQAAVAWSKLSDALGSPMTWQIPVWFALGLAAAVRGLWFLPEVRGRKRPGVEDAPLFASLILTLGALLFLLFVAISRLPTQPWYWLPLMVPGAVCIDAALAGGLGRYRIGRLVWVVLMVGVPFAGGVTLARERQTNLDLIAARLHQEAGPKDLILVYPWYHGVTFNRYYTGAAPWTTLPALADWRIHRYELLKEKLAAMAPIKPVLDRIAQTLASGNRLWIVGDLPTPEPGETGPPDLPPAPEGPQGWLDVPYSYVWGRQVEQFIAVRGGRMEAVPVGPTNGVSIYEKASLSVVTGLGLR